METKQTRRIRAVSDDGREFVILEYSSYQDQETINGQDRDPSVVTYLTEELIPVNRVGEDLYEVQTEPEPIRVRPHSDASARDGAT